jgi:hypothetical protein
MTLASLQFLQLTRKQVQLAAARKFNLLPHAEQKIFMGRYLHTIATRLLLPIISSTIAQERRAHFAIAITLGEK